MIFSGCLCVTVSSLEKNLKTVGQSRKVSSNQNISILPKEQTNVLISPLAFNSMFHTQQTFAITQTHTDISHIHIVFFGIPPPAPTYFIIPNKTLYNLDPEHISNFISYCSSSHSLYAKYISF